MIDDYEKDVNSIKSNALTLARYMRGGASYEDILNMSIAERESINKIIEDAIELAKKGGPSTL